MVTERPQTVVPDGQPRPVPGFPGLAMTSTRPDGHAAHRRQARNGSIPGQGTYAVSADGRWLTAITAGFDAQLRQFEQRTSWDRRESQG